MRWTYLGNHSVPWCTEVHIAASLEAEGHEVVRVQEGETPAADVAGIVERERADVLLWTRTYGLAETGGTAEQRAQMVADVRASGRPVVGVHLDRWWGLARETQVTTDPYFRVDLLCTADGDNDDRWAEAGVNHRWLRPGVYHAEVGAGTPRDEYTSEIGFVGNWQGGYHAEWPFRRQMVRWLRSRYRRRVTLWPRPGHGAVRGSDLADLYASVGVVVGDSCFADTAVRYTSDRPYETVGRGGFLVYPRIPAVADDLTEGQHAVFYKPGDLTDLGRVIDRWAGDDRADERCRIALAGMAHVGANHTYRRRMRELVAIMADEGLVPAKAAV